MPPAHSELSRNQQAMLDLALVCDLADAKPQDHDTIRLRHRGIITHAAAAAYIHEVEERVRVRRHVTSRI
jgi:hypothetical protein